MAESTSVALHPSVGDEDLRRAEEFTREPFVHEGEDAAAALAEGTARRRALDDALAEIDAGRDEPSVEWRQQYSLMLGLERLLADDEPHLADGMVLNAHQVDALSGTLTALIAEIERQNGNGAGVLEVYEDEEDVDAEDDELSAVEDADDEYEDADEDDEEESEPADWPEASEVNGRDDIEEDQLPEQPEDPGAARRFWFEHATGAGKTVAALGFVEGSRTGGTLILTHRRNLVDQFLGELRDRGYRKRINGPLLRRDEQEPPATGPVT